jgi:hypothetical protein
MEYSKENIKLLSLEQLLEILPEYLSLHKDSGSHDIINRNDEECYSRNWNEPLIDFLRRVYDAEIRKEQLAIDAKAKIVLECEAAGEDRDEACRRLYGECFFGLTTNEFAVDVDCTVSRFGLWKKD